MWAVLIVVFVATLGGWYGWPAEQRQEVVAQQQASDDAANMAIYRQAVVAYFKANDVKDTSVSVADLKQAGVLPAWSRLADNPAATTWANYRDSAGQIYIFPAAARARPIGAELLALSRHSFNVGNYHAADHTLKSPVDGKRVALPSLGSAAIPDGAPVWLATPD